MTMTAQNCKKTRSIFLPMDADVGYSWEHKITGAQELDPHEIKGGIIADEMGLGKSLVVLSSIAGSIDRSFRYLERMHESYARVSAQISNPPSPSHATLIIVPSSSEFHQMHEWFVSGPNLFNSAHRQLDGRDFEVSMALISSTIRSLAH